jgi:hypothetical protein
MDELERSNGAIREPASGAVEASPADRDRVEKCPPLEILVVVQ